MGNVVGLAALLISLWQGLVSGSNTLWFNADATVTQVLTHLCSSCISSADTERGTSSKLQWSFPIYPKELVLMLSGQDFRMMPTHLYFKALSAIREYPEHGNFSSSIVASEWLESQATLNVRLRGKSTNTIKSWLSSIGHQRWVWQDNGKGGSWIKQSGLAIR